MHGRLFFFSSIDISNIPMQALAYDREPLRAGHEANSEPFNGWASALM